MKIAAEPKRRPAETRQKLIDATVRLMVRQGFTATTVDQICAEAGLTKGSFFHYFDSKEAIGHSALEWWAAMGTQLYSAAWEDTGLDPVGQIHRFFDIMVQIAERPGDATACLVGMLSQEMSETNPALRASCGTHLTQWADNARNMLAAAKVRQGVAASDFDPAEVAWFLNSLWQGSMLIAKTLQDQQIIIRNLHHGRSYVDTLLGVSAAVSSALPPAQNARLRKAPSSVRS